PGGPLSSGCDGRSGSGSRQGGSAMPGSGGHNVSRARLQYCRAPSADDSSLTQHHSPEVPSARGMCLMKFLSVAVLLLVAVTVLGVVASLTGSLPPVYRDERGNPCDTPDEPCSIQARRRPCPDGTWTVAVCFVDKSPLDKRD